MSSSECYSIESLESALEYAITNNALVIYWHHGTGQFMYMTAADKDTTWKEELKRLKSYCRDVRVSSITTGEPINVGGTDLHPMELVMDLQCYAYSLLRRRGNLDDANKTPYFFLGKQTRDKTAQFLEGGAR